MKKVVAILLAALMITSLCACGEKTEPEVKATSTAADAVLDAAAVEALAGTAVKAGDQIASKDCATMICYTLPIPDGSDVDALTQEAAKSLEDQGYVSIAEMGEGSGKIYSAFSPDGATLSIPATDTSVEEDVRPGVESGGSRRFNVNNSILTIAGVAEWTVTSVEQQDYYEENGQQLPCYFLTLSPAA